MARVLVVEDDEAVARVIELSLDVAGHSPTVAGDGQTALKLFPQADPEVVLLDWMMPGMDGLQMLDELRKRGWRSRCRVVLVTAKVDETEILRGWQAGVDAYVTKPFEDIAQVVDEVMASTPEQLEQRRSDELRRARFLRALDDLDGF